MNLPQETLLQGGKYRIVRFINSGGFGCTYEAEHVMLEKRVAIKEFFVKDFCNRDEHTAHVTVGTLSKKGLVEKLRRKFVDEAKALCHLSHPGIVKVSDVFEENGTAYFVMDYVDGPSLSEIVNKCGKLPEDKALRYIRQLSEALAYVHSHNRLHLDIKPANIIINAKDNAVLIDFGASKQYDEADGENTSTLIGKTPGYAPLEQIGNDVVKFFPATDIYALGATFYKLLTGNTPPSANLLASGEELVALPSFIGANVAKAVDAAMQTNKKLRPQTVEDFLQILNSKVADEATVVGVESTADKKPEKDKKPQEEKLKEKQTREKNYNPGKKNTSYIVPVSVAAVLLAVLFIWAPWKDTSNQVSPTDLNVPADSLTDKIRESALKFTQDVSLTCNGTSFTYSGYVDSQGKAQGKGVGIYKAGTYTGNYKDNSREGQGSFVTSDGSNKFEGTFKNDQYAKGRMTMEDGEYYVGTFKNNNFNTGKWYKKNGSFDSEMENGEYI